MEQLRFDQAALTARLARLGPRDRAEFAFDCAERLLPKYQWFHQQTGEGEPEVLGEALRVARAQLEGANGTTADLKPLADRCQALVPVEDDSWTDLSGLAQNAAAAAAYAIRSLISDSVDDAVWAGVQGYEAADLVASTELDVDFNEPGVEERIVVEDVVQRELHAQDELLSKLQRSRAD
jgi:uncharacterized protein YjaG (DUF416 family)